MSAHFKKQKFINIPLAIYMTIVMFFLSASVKFIGQEQVRPFLYYGYFLIVTFAVLSLFKMLQNLHNVTIPEPVILFLLTILLALIFFQSIYDFQSFKNYIMLLIHMVGLPFSTYFFLGRGKLDVYVQSIAMAFLIYSMLMILTAVFMFQGNDIRIFGIVFESDRVFGLRIHGLAGEPTHFGTIVAIGILSLVFLHSRNVITNIPLMLLLASSHIVCLISSGSRNSILSVIISLTLVYGPRFKLGLFKLASIVASLITITLIFIYFDYIDELSAIFRLSDSSSENIRLNRLYITVQQIVNGNVVELLFGHGFRFDRIIELNVMSGYLSLLFNNGLFGLLLYILILAVMFVFYLKYKKKSQYISDYFISLLVYFVIFNIFLDVSFIVLLQIAGLILPISVSVALFAQSSAKEKITLFSIR